MKLTPLDIHQKEFRHGLRGYVEEEVDQFLDQVASELERLFKENIDLSDKIEQLQAKVDEYDVARHTINNTLLTAQRSADEIVIQAKIDAESTVTQANNEAEATVKQAKDHAASIEAEMARQHRELVAEIARVKQLEETFRDDFRAILDKHMAALVPMAVPGAVEQLLEAGQGFDEAAVAPAPVAAVEETAVFVVAEQNAAEPVLADEPEVEAEAEPESGEVETDAAAGAPERELTPETEDAPEPVAFVGQPAPEREPETAPEAEPEVTLDFESEPEPEAEPFDFAPETGVMPAADTGSDAARTSPTPPWFNPHSDAPASEPTPAPAEPVVSSIMLGEIEPEASAASFETQVMDEISLPGFDALGELDEDVEEID